MEKKCYNKNLSFEKDISIKLDQNKIYREPLKNGPVFKYFHSSPA